MVDLEDPIAVALLVSEALEASGLEHCLYGALALAAYGEARQTRDADFCVLEVKAAQAAEALRLHGLQFQVAFEDLLFGGLSISRLTLLPDLRHSGSNTADLVSPTSPRYGAAVLERSLRGPLRGRELRIVCPEDFVLLKVLSTRERDLSDAASVLAHLPDRLDWPLLEAEVDRLVSEVGGHDVAGRFATARGLANSLPRL